MKKGITLIAVLVAVLAVTSGAFAAAKHYLITSSSQIKDGAVSAADLSPTARKALQGEKGNTGAAGQQGPAGAQGLKGDTGAQGPKGDKGDSGAGRSTACCDRVGQPGVVLAPKGDRRRGRRVSAGQRHDRLRGRGGCSAWFERARHQDHDAAGRLSFGSRRPSRRRRAGCSPN